MSSEHQLGGRAAAGPGAGTMESHQAIMVVRLVALGVLAAGAVIGFALPVTTVGADSQSTADLANAHPVNCGSALHQAFSSIACQNALSGRKTTALALMIIGAVVLLGTFTLAASFRERFKALDDGAANALGIGRPAHRPRGADEPRGGASGPPSGDGT